MAQWEKSLPGWTGNSLKERPESIKSTKQANNVVRSTGSEGNGEADLLIANYNEKSLKAGNHDEELIKSEELEILPVPEEGEDRC